MAAIGVAATAAVAKVTVGALTKGVDKRISKQLGAGAQFSPELSIVALERDIAQRERAITRGSLLGESARELSKQRDTSLAISGVLGSTVSNEVNELQAELLRKINPVIGDLVEAILRAGKFFGAVDESTFAEAMESLVAGGVNAGPDIDPASVLSTYASYAFPGLPFFKILSNLEDRIR